MSCDICSKAKADVMAVVASCPSVSMKIETIWGYVVEHSLPPTRRIAQTSHISEDKCFLSVTVEEGDHIFHYSLFWKMNDREVKGSIQMVRSYMDTVDNNSETRTFETVEEFENYLKSEVL